MSIGSTRPVWQGESPAGGKISVGLTLDDERYALCLVAATGKEATQGRGWTLLATRDECLIALPETLVPQQSESESGYRLLALESPRGLRREEFVLAVVTPLLAEGIEYYSVYPADGPRLLVAQAHLDDAIATLREAGHDVMAPNRLELRTWKHASCTGLTDQH